jgi:hypothetical protein
VTRQIPFIGGPKSGQYLTVRDGEHPPEDFLVSSGAGATGVLYRLTRTLDPAGNAVLSYELDRKSPVGQAAAR